MKFNSQLFLYQTLISNINQSHWTSVKIKKIKEENSNNKNKFIIEIQINITYFVYISHTMN